MLDEKWVPVEGFPNYAVSNYGEVINVNTNRTLSERKCKDGRRRVVLYVKGVPHARMVNRLVAEAFFLNYQDGIEVNHINGDHGDCSVLNLTIGNKACRKRTGE